MRIYAEPSDQLLSDINRAVKEKGIGKTQIVLEALDQYLHDGDHEEKEELSQARSELEKAKTDLTQNWSEITRQRSEITALKADLDKARSLADKLVIENDQLRKTSDQASSDLEILRRDHQHFKDTLDLKDKQISFLEAHIAQLTQSIGQLALKPSPEEIRAKSWWKFWG